MNEKKPLSSIQWLWMFAGSVLLLALLVAGFNFAVDPYGAFGDRFLQWWSYDETLNPRMAKISYLETHHDQFDSYIVGSSGSSSYPVEELDRYLDARFFNCFFYGTSMADFEELCVYLLEHYEVKNLVLNLSMNIASQDGVESTRHDLTSCQHYKVDGSNPLLFYAKYLFHTPADSWEKLQRYWSDGYLQQFYRVFRADTGAYDKSLRDAEPIGALEDYLSRPAYAEFLDYPRYQRPLTAVEEAVERVAHVKRLCEERGVKLLVLCQPCYYEAFAYYTAEDTAAFRDALAQVTDYWDFSYSSVSFEPRYFYDATHFRNGVGTMALGRIFGNGDVYIPEDFGQYVPQGSRPGAPRAEALPEEAYTAQVPVLMYHMAPDNFEEHMRALSDAGCHTVSFAQLKSYVEQGTGLPEKPVVLTFDDGYSNNYLLAYPVLQKYGFQAAIFAIGVSMGKDTYKDSGEAMNPHFSLEEAAEMEASGLVTVGSHGYNIHEVEGRDQAPIRRGVLQREDETEAEYVAFLQEDCRHMLELLGDSARIVAYPYGECSELSEVVLSQEGVYATLTTDPKRNTIVRGLPQSLRQLGRYDVGEGMTGSQLLELLGYG